MTGRIARGIAGGIGLARESAAHHKESKEAKENLQVPSEGPPRSRSPSPSSGADSNDDTDHELWELDDFENTEAPPPNPFSRAQNNDELVNTFEQLHPPAYSESVASGKLDLPVIIPQRRPKHKTRGFVRAYAPELQEVGIDQKTWLDFLSGFEEAIKMHQAFNALQVVVRGTDLAVQIVSSGNILAHLASWVIHAGVEASRRGYVQYRTNKYLDEMNLRFFRPHGLYSLIMCYKPSDSIYPQVSDSIPSAVSQRVDGDGSKLSRSSGTTRSEMALPESAPLIFPELDAVPEDKKPGAAKRAGEFLSDYYDRRAQAVFEYNNPNSKLNVGTPRKEFASRYSDPNSPAVNGGLVGLVTGGKVLAPRARRKQKRKERQLATDGRVNQRSRMAAEDVYYLMVINMPTDAEIEQAKGVIAHDGGLMQ